MPWEALVNRLDKYLEFARLCVLLSGLVLAAEVVGRTVTGTPADRRAWLHDQYFAVYHQKPSPLVALVVLIVALVGAYLAGLVMSLLSSWLHRVILRLVWVGKLIAVWMRRGRAASPILRAARPRGGWFLKSLISTLGLRRTTSDDTWGRLTHSYGEDRVRAALSRHPLKLAVGGDDQAIYAALDYFEAWLKKHAPDQVVSTRSNLSVFFFGFAVPLLLLPGAVTAYAGDQPWAGQAVSVLWWVVVVAVVWLIVRISTMGPTFAYAILWRWMTVELVLTHGPGSIIPPSEPLIPDARQPELDIWLPDEDELVP